MRTTTHAAFGLLIAAIIDLFITYSTLQTRFLFYVLVIAGSLFPDADYIKGMKNMHRGMLHSIYPSFILGLAAFQYPLLFGAAAGIMAHIALDAGTPQGIRLMYPFIRIKGNIRTGSLTDKTLGLMAIMTAIIMIVYQGFW